LCFVFAAVDVVVVLLFWLDYYCILFDFLCFYAVTLSYFWVVVVIVADNAVDSLAFGNVAVAKLLL